MAITNAKAEMKFIDTTALADSTVSTQSGQDIDNLALLSGDDVSSVSDYGTLEKNLFILDGSKVIPSNPRDIGFISSEMSDQNCNFINIPSVEVDFTVNHTSSGLTLYFDRDYPAEIKITWYTLNGSELTSKVYHPDSLEYICVNQVKNYGKLKIEFLKTNLPNQYARLQYILYGKYVKWHGDTIKKASVVEDIDIVSAQISINTANIEILDIASDFDIGNPNGAWLSVQKNQPVKLYEEIDGVEIPMGSFFIDKFSFTDNTAKFSMIDTVGLLDQSTFYDGEIYVKRTAGAIIDSIMASAGITKYTVSDDVAGIELNGYLAIQTCRKALQIVSFVCGAVIDDSRSDTIAIYKPVRPVRYTIDIDRKFNGNTKVSLDDYYSGVSIEFSKYSLKSESDEIYSDYLPVGDNTITFSNPYKPDTITVSGGTIKKVATNYIVVTMDSEAECTITGQQYESSKFTTSQRVSQLDAGESENIKKYTGITLYNAQTVKETMASIMKYLGLRKEVKIKYLIQTEKVGDWGIIKDREGRSNLSLIEKQTIDLTGGFISTSENRGYTLINTNGYFAGNELIANEGIGGALL